jgi:hypothetical protein
LSTGPNHPLKINAPPTHNAVNRQIRAGFDNLTKLFHLFIAQQARSACAFAVGQTIHTLIVEPVNPIAQRLAIHAPDPGGFSAAHPVIDRRKSQKPANLAAIHATFGKQSKVRGIKIGAKRNTGRHGKSPLPPMNQIITDLRIPQSQNLMPLGSDVSPQDRKSDGIS